MGFSLSDPHLVITDFKPGRYANMIQKSKSAQHNRQLIRDDMTSAFILTLNTDGSASLCRGWRYLSTNDGPRGHSKEHLREQLGYSGHWNADDKGAKVTLKRDPSVCSQIGEYSNLVPDHAEEWTLRCLCVLPKDHSRLRAPTLLCQIGSATPAFGEDEPHIVEGLVEGSWIVLGAGNGLRIVITSNAVGGKSPDLQVENAQEPIQENAWEDSFTL